MSLCLGKVLLLTSTQKWTVREAHINALMMRWLLDIVEELSRMLLRHRHALVLVEAARSARIIKWVHTRETVEL